MNDGGPAFPYSALIPDAETRQMVGTIYADNRGMTLRDYFAAHALQGLLANFISHPNGVLNSDYADIAYTMADQMLQQREKK